MTRAALLPAGNDPFVIAYWLRNYATWAHLVDELHITVAGSELEPDALAYIQECVSAAPNATMEYFPRRTDHGQMLTHLLTKTQADTIMLCEDDAFVRKPETVAECFAFAESGGIAATTRGGYAAYEIIDAAAVAFGKQYAYWPCFVFIAREHLEATDRHFSGKVFEPGDVVLGHTMVETGGADTFVWASYQLRALGLPEKLIDNHRLSGQPVPDDAPWFHVGSLSSGHGSMFMADQDDVRYRFEVDMFRRLPPGNAWQRFGWWQRAWEVAKGAIPDYHERYAVEIAKFRDDVGLSAKDVAAYRSVADGLVTWGDR